MIAWLKNLLLGFDRTSAATERTAKAAEDIADTMESLRDQLRSRLGIEAAAPAKQLPAAEPEEEEEKPRKGRSR